MTHICQLQKNIQWPGTGKKVPLNPKRERLAYPHSANNSNTVQTRTYSQSKWQDFYINFTPHSAEVYCIIMPMGLAMGGSCLTSSVYLAPLMDMS